MNAFEKPFRLLSRAAGATLVAGILAGGATAPLFAQDDQSSAPMVVALSNTSPLFEADGKRWTVEDFEDAVRLAPPSSLRGMNPMEFDLIAAEPEAIREAVREFVVQHQAALRAEEAGMELPEEAAARLETDLQRLKNQIWLDDAGIFEAGEITDEEIEARYEELKDERYIIDEQLRFRHIFLSTYHEYEVEDGDTLESIAGEVSGDAALADRILDPADRMRPRMEPGVTPEGEPIPPRALTAGEVLMVPMSDDDAMAVKERIDKIYTELQNGGDFRELADQYGENPTKGDQLVVHPARDDKPLLEEMREVFDSLEDGEVSEPFRTKHGWQVLRRDAYREAGYTPLERVRVTIENAMRNERREEKFMAIMNDLWEDYEGLNINEDVLARAGEEEVADEIIFQVDDYKFTGSQFDQQFGDEITEDTTLEERRALLAKLPTIQQLLVNEDIDDRGLAETEAWENASSRIEDVYLSEVWLREQLATELFEPTEEAISDKFEDSREQLESMPALRLWQITVTPEIEEGMSELEVAEATQQAIDELNAELEKVASRADFESLAKQISEDAFARVGGAIGLKSQRFRDGLGRQLLLSAEENTVAGPFEDPETNEVTAYWVGEKTERGEVTIEEYRAELEQAVTRDLMEEYREEMQESLLEEAGFELLMPEES